MQREVTVHVCMLQVFLTRDHLAIAMEYAEGGDLHSTWSRKPDRRLPEDQARWIFQQLIIGLDYCHRKVQSEFWYKHLHCNDLVVVQTVPLRFDQCILFAVNTP